MNRKITGIVLLVIGLIALIGAGVFMYIIIEFSTALGALTSADTTVMSQFGVDTSQMTSIIETINTVIAMGSVWLITVIISALFSMYAGIRMLMRKK